VVIIVIGKGPDERRAVLEKANALAAELRGKGLGVIVDDDETKGPGFKYFEYELTGVCVRVELGPKDLAKDQCVMVRRDVKQKEFIPLGQAAARAGEMLEAMQKDLFQKAKTFRDAHTFQVGSMEEMKKRADDGFLLAHWCESAACVARIKEETGGVTSRNRPFDLPQHAGSCVVCGSPSPGELVWSKAY
jgi:prolyl-tRNA synthetase